MGAACCFAARLCVDLLAWLLIVWCGLALGLIGLIVCLIALIVLFIILCDVVCRFAFVCVLMSWLLCFMYVYVGDCFALV